MHRPIVIVGTPRSGTSLTAGLFAQHGVWTGPCRPADKHNPHGYFESEPFKRALIEGCGAVVNAGITAKPVLGWTETVHKILAQHGYNGGPWLVKHSAMYWPVWRDFRPIWVCCRRDRDAIAASGKATRYLTQADAIEPHVEAMEHLRDQHGAHEVWPEAFVRGEFLALEPAFEEAGVTFDRDRALAFVDPGLWHAW